MGTDLAIGYDGGEYRLEIFVRRNTQAPGGHCLQMIDYVQPMFIHFVFPLPTRAPDRGLQCRPAPNA